MAGENQKTTYRVETVYDITDKASDALGKIEKNASRAADSTARLSSMALGVGAAFVGGRGLSLANSMLIGFNSTVEDTKVKIAGMMALATKTDLSVNVERANRLYSELQQRAMTLPGTTAEYVEMAGRLTQPIMDAGLGMRQLRDMTIATTVAAKGLGIDAGASARDVDQALRGQYHSVDQFTGKLLGANGYAGEAGREKFNALTPEKRAAEIMKAVDSKQIKQLGQAQGATFSGVMSTVQDRIEQMAGKIGKPLFGAITKEVESWNKWLENNNSKIDHFAETVGGGIVAGFRYAKSAGMFLVDHADTLISIAKAWAVFKVGGALGGSLGGMFGGITKKGMGEFFSGGMSMKGLGGAAGGLGLGGMLGIGMLAYEFSKAAGITASLTQAIDNDKFKLDRLTGTMDRFDEAVGAAHDRLQNSFGAKAGMFYANASTQFAEDKTKADVLDNILSGRGMPSWMSEMGGGLGSMARSAWATQQMRDANMDEDEISGATNHMAGRAAFYRSRSDNGINLNANAGLVDIIAGTVFASMGNKAPEMVTQQKITNMLLQESILLQGMDGRFKADYLRARGQQLANELDPDFKKQAKVNQTVNVNINQVSAKDPDRWIAEMDAYAARRVSARTRAKSALGGRGF